MKQRDKLKVITEANNRLEQSYLKSKGLLFEGVDRIDIQSFYKYSENPDPKLANEFKGKYLSLDDLVRTREGQELMANPKLADAIKNLEIKINTQKTSIDHPQDLARIMKALIRPGVLNFDEFVKTPNIGQGLKDNSNWTREVINKVASREGLNDGELGGAAQRLMDNK